MVMPGERKTKVLGSSRLESSRNIDRPRSRLLSLSHDKVHRVAPGMGRALAVFEGLPLALQGIYIYMRIGHVKLSCFAEGVRR